VICRTPGCNTPIPEKDPESRYCERCGWPLAQGLLTPPPDSVTLQGSLPATVRLRADNQGGGRLKWKVLELPRGVTLLEESPEVGPGTHGTTTLSIDPSQVADQDLALKVRLWDKVGSSSQDLRPTDREQCWREESVHLRLRRQRHGPLTTGWKTLLFGASTSSVAVKVVNEGESELQVRARVSEGYVLEAPGKPRAEKQENLVLGGTPWVLTVSTRPGQAPQNGQLVVEADQLPSCNVELVHLDVKPIPRPQEQWVVAIDFGTTKSAVVVLDQYCRGAEPQPVLWARQGSEPETWLPSAVAMNRQGWPERFGWEIPFTETGESIYRSLKMRLREDDAAVRKCIVYFMARLLERTAGQFDSIFENARVVFTLPVLDNGALYEEQRRRTLECALEAGSPFGLTEDRIDFYKEPECAAVDFLHRLMVDPSSGIPKSGEWLCVLDMGGGTTDVTFAQMSVMEDGRPGFDVLHSYGYEGHAGDRVDLEFYGWVIDKWLATKRLKGVQGQQKAVHELSREALMAAPSLQLEGEKLSYGRASNLNQMQFHKERMYNAIPPQNVRWEEFTKTDNSVLLVPDELAPTLQELARKIFIEGIQSEGVGIPSVRNALGEIPLTSDKISFLCLTGGTSRIPLFEEYLRSQVLVGTRMRTLVDREDIRRNVVLGAVRRPALRIRGILPCNLVLTFRHQDGPVKTSPPFPLGTVPGAEKTEHEHILRGQTVEFALRADFPGHSSMVLFTCPVTNDHEVVDDWGGLNLKARLAYGVHGALRLHLAWECDPPLPEILPATMLQELPCL